jgi:nucleotide-binding universal stress UspA family protein
VTEGFTARPLARRALAESAERSAVTTWRAVLDVADEEAVDVIVLGSRGRSAVKSDRPVLIIPPS